MSRAFLGKANSLLIRRPSTFVFRYLKQIAIDYRDALIETGKTMVQRPMKTLFYSSNISLLIYAYRSMPSFHSYRNDLIAFNHQQLLSSTLIRNREVETYVDTIEQLLSREQLHFIDCYLFSLIIYKDQHRTTDKGNRLYENLCSYLHLKRHARVIDIGAFNRWFILNRQLRRADQFDDINKDKSAL